MKKSQEVNFTNNLVNMRLSPLPIEFLNQPKGKHIADVNSCRAL